MLPPRGPPDPPATAIPARVARVGHGLDGGEGLRGDDDEGGAGVEAEKRVVHMRAVDVRHENGSAARRHRVFSASTAMTGPRVRPADADVDDVGYPAAGRVGAPSGHPPRRRASRRGSF